MPQPAAIAFARANETEWPRDLLTPDGELWYAKSMGEAPPTHVFVQAGVGALAASVCAAFWLAWEAHRPELVVVDGCRATIEIEERLVRGDEITHLRHHFNHTVGALGD